MISKPIDVVRRVCPALPEACEQEARGEPTFRVRNKIVARYASAGTHHGRGRHAVWCKAPLGVQELPVRSEPERFFVSPYVGVGGWIGIDPARMDAAELRDQVGAAVLRRGSGEAAGDGGGMMVDWKLLVTGRRA